MNYRKKNIATIVVFTKIVMVIIVINVGVVSIMILLFTVRAIAVFRIAMDLVVY